MVYILFLFPFCRVTAFSRRPGIASFRVINETLLFLFDICLLLKGFPRLYKCGTPSCLSTCSHKISFHQLKSVLYHVVLRRHQLSQKMLSQVLRCLCLFASFQHFHFSFSVQEKCHYRSGIVKIFPYRRYKSCH